MLTIRLQRTGSRNKPSFRIVLAEAQKSASKKFIEILGHYNPTRKDFGIKDEQRLKYWIAQNVSISPTVHNLLVEKKIVEGKKVKAWQAKKKPAESGTTSGGETPSAAPAAAAPAEPAPTEEAPATPEAKTE